MTRLNLSINEIEATTQKAAAATGVMTAQAEDVARACGWLAANGYDAAAALAADIPRPSTSPPMQSEDGGWVFNNARAAVCGVAALDLLITAANAEARLLNLDSPLLLFGLAAVAAADHTLTFTLNCPNGWRVSTATAPDAAPLMSAKKCDVVVRQSVAARPRTGDEHKVRPARGVTLDAAAWKKIKLLAARRLVPSNTVSRSKGAGAEILSDND